jgi:outer membrane lipoprotein carrier protein
MSGEPPGASTEASDPADCGRELARRVQARYEGVRDLHATFRQTTRSAAFAGSATADQKTNGEVWFAKPGRMRWVYEAPTPSLVVSDGETLWIYDPDAREAQSMPVTQGFLSGAAFQFLLGEGRILDTFDASAQDCGNQRVRLVLKPLADATYERLELQVDRETGDVHATAIDDLFGNRTEVEFDSLRTNQGPPDDRFVFVAPEGVRVERLAP